LHQSKLLSDLLPYSFSNFFGKQIYAQYFSLTNIGSSKVNAIGDFFRGLGLYDLKQFYNVKQIITLSIKEKQVSSILKFEK